MCTFFPQRCLERASHLPVAVDVTLYLALSWLVVASWTAGAITPVRDPGTVPCACYVALVSTDVPEATAYAKHYTALKASRHVCGGILARPSAFIVAWYASHADSLHVIFGSCRMREWVVGRFERCWCEVSTRKQCMSIVEPAVRANVLFYMGTHSAGRAPRKTLPILC